MYALAQGYEVQDDLDELAHDPAMAGKIVQIALRYANISTLRRMGKLLEKAGVEESLVGKLARKLTPSSALIPWVPSLLKRGTVDRRWGWSSTMSSDPRRYHEDADLFRAALSFTCFALTEELRGFKNQRSTFAASARLL